MNYHDSNINHYSFIIEIYKIYIIPLVVYTSPCPGVAPETSVITSAHTKGPRSGVLT
jgi:hypothetical protein